MKISWIDVLKNEEVLLKIKEERNILRTVKRKKANWIGHILRNNQITPLPPPPDSQVHRYIASY
jgi:hypothetical protein